MTHLSVRTRVLSRWESCVKRIRRVDRS